MEGRTDPSHFGEVDAIVLEAETLRIADTLPVLLGLEAGEVCSMRKEAFVGFLQVRYLGLQHLAIGLFEPEVIGLRLERRDSALEIVEGEGYAGFPVVLLPARKSPIVGVPGMTKLHRQLVTLLTRRIQAVAKCLAHQHELSPSFSVDQRAVSPSGSVRANRSCGLKLLKRVKGLYSIFTLFI